VLWTFYNFILAYLYNNLFPSFNDIYYILYINRKFTL